MLFSSPEFLFLFLPIAMLIYFALPPRLRNGALLFVSLLFYGVSQPKYLLLLIATVGLTFAFGLAMRTRRKRVWLILAVALNLSALVIFKYYNLFAGLLRGIPSSPFEDLPVLELGLPVGISFYTFAAISYLVDVYRGEEAQRNIVSLGTYISMFPQISAGPIVKYRDIHRSLAGRDSSLYNIERGIMRFVCGLSKKLLIADPCNEMWQTFLSADTVLGAWLALLFFSLRIYFDFSGYSDMAIGLGRILGFDFPENFNYPYVADGIKDFWRRWHISLSTWFRDYVYIPLGGNRCGTARTVLNMLAVWLLTGLWHGASLNFVLWGLYYFALLVLERFVFGRALARLPLGLRRALTLLLVGLGWLIFAFEDISELLRCVRLMLGAGGFCSREDIYELCRSAVLLVVAVVGATPLPKRIWASLRRGGRAERAAVLVCTVMTFVVCVAYLADSSYSPFLYFKF